MLKCFLLSKTKSYVFPIFSELCFLDFSFFTLVGFEADLLGQNDAGTWVNTSRAIPN
jgi:hypothetical protein